MAVVTSVVASAFVKMETLEYRGVIKFLCLKDNRPTQIKPELDTVYGDFAPSVAIVKKRSIEF